MFYDKETHDTYTATTVQTIKKTCKMNTFDEIRTKWSKKNHVDDFPTIMVSTPTPMRCIYSCFVCHQYCDFDTNKDVESPMMWAGK